jgi:hypothetical protein
VSRQDNNKKQAGRRRETDDRRDSGDIKLEANLILKEANFRLD